MNFKTQPMAHQLEALKLLSKRKSFILAWDVGTGKSKVIVDHVSSLIDSFRSFKSLIICPTSVVYSWVNEFGKHSNLDYLVQVLNGTKKQRLKKLENENKKIFIINYQGLLVLKDNLPKFDYVVFDELHYLKSHKAKRTKLALQLAFNATYRYGLTGTMILNNLFDVFSQMQVIDLGFSFGNNFYAFRNKYFYDKHYTWQGSSNYYPKWTPKEETKEEIIKRIVKYADRKEKKDCLDLPDVVNVKRYVELESDQLKSYKEMKAFMMTIIENEPPAIALNQLVKGLRLNQITSGHVNPTEGGDVIHFKSNAKLEGLEELLNELQEHKIIIWCVFRDDMEQIKNLLIKKHIKFVYIHGGTPQDIRGDLIDKFQSDPKYRIFVGNIAAAGIGITLTAADVAIFYSLNYNLGHYIQACGRNHRKGSEIHNKITYIHLLAKDTIDETILKAIEAKQNLAEYVLNSLKNER